MPPAASSLNQSIKNQCLTLFLSSAAENSTMHCSTHHPARRTGFEPNLCSSVSRAVPDQEDLLQHNTFSLCHRNCCPGKDPLINQQGEHLTSLLQPKQHNSCVLQLQSSSKLLPARISNTNLVLPGSVETLLFPSTARRCH